jgi:hypothetical protein
MSFADTINTRLAVFLLIILLLISGYTLLGTVQEPVMLLYTVAYTNNQAGIVYTLYDKKNDLKITTPDYELAANTKAPVSSYLTSPIICSISRTEPKTAIAAPTTDGQNRPLKIYHGMKANYKTDGAVYVLYLENGEVYEGCDAGKWNYNKLGPPQYVD